MADDQLTMSSVPGSNPLRNVSFQWANTMRICNTCAQKSTRSHVAPFTRKASVIGFELRMQPQKLRPKGLQLIFHIKDQIAGRSWVYVQARFALNSHTSFRLSPHEGTGKHLPTSTAHQARLEALPPLTPSKPGY